MRHSKGKRLFVCVLVMTILVADPTYASSTSTRLEDAKNKKQQAQQEIDNTKDALSDLNSERASLQQYVEALNQKLQTTSVELYELEELMQEKEQSIRQSEKALEDAREAEVAQYDAMKKRIKFMYECGNATYMNLLFTSTSFSEFLNKNEYFTKLTEYDRMMLQKYMELQEQMEREERDLKEAKEALEGLKADADAKSASVVSIVKEANANLQKYLDQIAEQEDKMLAYEQQLNNANNDIRNLQEQLAKEQQLTTNSVMRDLSNVTINAGDIDLMAAIIQCEAGGESYTGKVAVGAVVMNRVKSSSFPNSILEVIYQSRQFSPVASGRFAVVLARGADESCYQAARDAMNGVTPVGDKLFFRTPIPGLVGQQIGGHIFY